MEIMIKTNLKKIPDRCSKCRYSYNYREYCSDPMEKFCSVTKTKYGDRKLSQTYNKEKRNWEYERPIWCPLTDGIDIEKEYRKMFGGEDEHTKK